MGLIKDCTAAGFSEKWLLSLVPPFASMKTRKKNEAGDLVDAVVEGDGKTPAMHYREGLWGGIKGWQDGVDPAVLAKADAAGCNVGTILGHATHELHGYALVAVDIDLMGVGDSIAETKLCDQIERALSAAYAAQSHDGQAQRYVCWIRKTLSYRATILARIPVEAAPGTKHAVVYTPVDPITGAILLKPIELDAPEDDKQTAKSREIRHKVEFLATGQQTVIAGTHKIAGKIKWYRSDVPDQFFPVPCIAPETVPAFSSWSALLGVSLEAIAKVMQSADCAVPNITITKGKPPKPSVEHYEDKPKSTAADVSAPNADVLIRLINAMPNPEYVDRDTYQNVMLSIGGARWGLLQSKSLSLDNDDAIAEAAAQWAARWEGPTPGDYDAELLKVNADWFRQESYRCGFRTLLNHARDLGLNTSSFVLEDAQNSFTAEARPVSISPISELNWDGHAEHIVSDKSELTEFWLANEFMKYATGRIKWMPESKEWLAWHPSKGGWFTTNANEWIKDQIQHCLSQTLHGMQSASKDDFRSILTAAKVNNVEGLIRPRVVFNRSELNDSPWFLQTPDGSFSLKTGEKISMLQQRGHMDTRYTSCAPKEGPMPLWNSLLFHLADDNPATAEWLKYYAAYALIGDPSAHRMLFIHGPGMNGKSTFLNVLSGIFGTYAAAIDRDVWLEKSADKHPASFYRIRDTRLGYTSEMPPGELWNEPRLKAITGQDLVEARGMHKDPVPFRARAALLMVGQTIPTFRKVDTSISRRMAIVGTTRTPETAVPKLGERIIFEEGPCILFDLIRRCQELALMEQKLPELTKSMQSEIKDYLDKTDVCFAWVSAECVIGPAAGTTLTPIRVLQERYAAFVRRRSGGSNDDPLSQMTQVSEEAFLSDLRRVGVRFKDQESETFMVDGEPAVEGIKLRLSLAQAA